MSKCINSKMGNMLHAYELRSLNDSDRESFELHLLDCDHCFNELSSFNDEASILLNDRNIKNLMETQAADALNQKPAAKSLWQRLWPDKTPLVFKPAIAYALSVLIILLLPLSLERDSVSDIGSVQSIGFMSIRSTGHEVLVKSQSSHAVINFMVRNYKNVEVVKLRVTDSAGTDIYHNDDFGQLDKVGIGRLYLPLDLMAAGKYKFEVNSKDKTGESSINTYTFTVE